MKRSGRIPLCATTAVLLLSGVGGCGGEEAPSLRVLAAASAAAPIWELAARFEQITGRAVRVDLGASSTLARQIEAGATGDVVVTAHRKVMDGLARRAFVDAGSRRRLAGNGLVLAARRGSGLKIRATRDFPIDEVLDGPLVMGDPSHVPLGMYGREALEELGWWNVLQGRVVSALDARGAVALLEWGGGVAGVLYATDVARSELLEVVAHLPASSGRVVYEAAILSRSADPAARELMDFLSGDEAREIWGRHGFLPAPEIQPPAPSVNESAAAGPEGSALNAILLSLQVALTATLCTLPFGIGLAWLLARREFRGKVLVEALVTLPLVLPPVVVGFLLLSLLGANTPVGGFLENELGIHLAFSWIGAAIASAVMGFPLMVRTTRVALEAVDARLESVARTLGAGPLRAFSTVTLPLAMPGVMAALLLAFARCLGEFGATISFVGNRAGETQTLPLRIFTEAQRPGNDSQVAWLVGAAVLISICAVALSELLNRRITARRGG